VREWARRVTYSNQPAAISVHSLYCKWRPNDKQNACRTRSIPSFIGPVDVEHYQRRVIARLGPKPQSLGETIKGGRSLPFYERKEPSGVKRHGFSQYVSTPCCIYEDQTAGCTQWYRLHGNICVRISSNYVLRPSSPHYLPSLDPGA